MILRDGSRPNDPRLGRVAEFDDKSKLFSVGPKLREAAPSTATRKTWPLNLRLNQGQTPKCVGNAFAHEYAAGPDTHRVNQDFASEWYRQAQDRDQWAGSDYEGSSTLGGCKAGVDCHNVKEYLWCFTLQEVIDTILHFGPVITGTNWYRGMFRPSDSGFIVPTGQMDGGHEYILRGVNVTREFFLMTNSWGRFWGRNGDAKISFSDYDRLRLEDGDAVHVSR
jgi:papain like protease